MGEKTKDCPSAEIEEIRVQNNATVTDIAALRAAVVALTAKLDADAANTALDDTDYAATCDPAAQTSEAVTLK